MRISNTEAIILRTYHLGEADKIVVCLTAEEGVLRGVAQGARKLKSKFGASLEPFTVVRLTCRIREEKELAQIQEADIKQGYFDVAAEPELLLTWAELGEWVLAFAPPGEANPKLFALLEACLKVSAEKSAESADSLTANFLRALRLYFMIWLLKLSGLLPSWQTCGRCQQMLVPEAGLYVDGHYLYCALCRPARAVKWSVETYLLLTATRRQSPREFAAQSADEESWAALEQFAATLIRAGL